jgi:hypothetical protein
MRCVYCSRHYSTTMHCVVDGQSIVQSTQVVQRIHMQLSAESFEKADSTCMQIIMTGMRQLSFLFGIHQISWWGPWGSFNVNDQRANVSQGPFFSEFIKYPRMRHELRQCKSGWSSKVCVHAKNAVRHLPLFMWLSTACNAHTAPTQTWLESPFQMSKRCCTWCSVDRRQAEPINYYEKPVLRAIKRPFPNTYFILSDVELNRSSFTFSNSLLKSSLVMIKPSFISKRISSPREPRHLSIHGRLHQLKWYYEMFYMAVMHLPRSRGF